MRINRNLKECYMKKNFLTGQISKKNILAPIKFPYVKSKVIVYL